MSDILLIQEAIGNPEPLSPIAEQLQSAGFKVELCTDAEQGVARALSNPHSLTIIAFVSPVKSRLEVLREIRRQSLQPVMVLANSGGSGAERILAFELGADDYLEQPCLIEELTARIRAILRRSSGGISAFGHLLKVNDLELDKLKRSVRQNGRGVTLTTSEFDLLELLMKRVGQPVSREEVARTIFGRSLNLNDRSIDVHVSNLRKKLGAERIKTIRGVGYSFTLS
jgi:two-component system response regulator CpxR